MKKIASFCLIVLMLMNTMGYIFFWGVQSHSDRKMTNRLEKESFAHSDILTVKVPVSIPYVMDQEEFAPADGKFHYQGRYYRMVKQRYAKDTLTVICLRDVNSEQIQSALGELAKTFTDQSPDHSGQNSKLSFSFVKDFIGNCDCSARMIGGWTQIIAGKLYAETNSSVRTAPAGQPPEIA